MKNNIGMPLAELVFGKNDCDELLELYFCKDINQKDARKVLDAIVHPEMQEAIDVLVTQMQINEGNPSQIRYHNPERTKKYGYGAMLFVENILFTQLSYNTRLLSSFKTLLEQAYPEYEIVSPEKKYLDYDSTPHDRLYEIVMGKRKIQSSRKRNQAR